MLVTIKEISKKLAMENGLRLIELEHQGNGVYFLTILLPDVFLQFFLEIQGHSDFEIRLGRRLIIVDRERNGYATLEPSLGQIREINRTFHFTQIREDALMTRFGVPREKDYEKLVFIPSNVLDSVKRFHASLTDELKTLVQDELFERSDLLFSFRVSWNNKDLY